VQRRQILPLVRTSRLSDRQLPPDPLGARDGRVGAPRPVPDKEVEGSGQPGLDHQPQLHRRDRKPALGVGDSRAYQVGGHHETPMTHVCLPRTRLVELSTPESHTQRTPRRHRPARATVHAAGNETRTTPSSR
jgi:hypothetical protein